MYLSKKHLSRRTVLRGAGACIGLPLLDAMIPAGVASAQTAATGPSRVAFVYFPHGAVMNRWSPSQAGRDFGISEILQPLEHHREHMTIVSGLRNRPAESSLAHEIVERTWLSCVAPDRVGVDDPDAGVTADQLAARYIGQETATPSLELTTELRSSPISFRTPTQSLPMEYNPRKVFYRLFGQGDTDEERVAINRENGSLLDLVTKQAARLRADLGGADRIRVEGYLDSVREIERRVQMNDQKDPDALSIPEAPIGVPNDFREHIPLMFELMGLALQADLTRVITFAMAKEVSMRTYSNLSISEAFHPLSHHGDDPTKLDKLVAIQQYHTQLFAAFIDRLAATEDGDGSILDHSTILFGSNMSNSDLHNQDPLPNVLLGHAHGRIRGGQHLRYPQDSRFADLLLTILDKNRVPVETIGDSDATLMEV